jgi:hypothetical protein
MWQPSPKEREQVLHKKHFEKNALFNYAMAEKPLVKGALA